MSLLGIDAGTSGCKAALFSETGRLLAQAYVEYDMQRPEPHLAQLDAADVWRKIKQIIRQVTTAAADPVKAISFSSLGEAMVPVGRDGRILGPSLVPTFDQRGADYLPELAANLPEERLYQLNGNALGNIYSLTKLKWLREHQPGLYAQTHKFLLWGSFIPTMLGAEPHVDYSLANRTMLFDVNRADWSDELLAWAGLDRDKLPAAVPSGTVVGQVSKSMAAELGLPAGAPLVSGAHDQCANAVGCGVIEKGLATFGMGTFFCITPAFSRRRDPAAMLARGLNTEHHAVPGLFVSFIYNQGGILVKWFRDTFAAADTRQARQAGLDIYDLLTAELPARPSSVLVLPHFAPTGPPRFTANSRGVMAGLQLHTSRGDIMKGILEGAAFYLKEIIDTLPAIDIPIHEYRPVGGGSKSDSWVQLCADIMGAPFVRPRVSEAGALGAAIMAGVGSGLFASFPEAVSAMVQPERTFEPNPAQTRRYAARFEKYARLEPLLQDYLQELAQEGTESF
jgi:xylulokinase